jgi:hypothetical protein
MPGWHVDNQPLYLALSHFLESLSHFGVVRPMYKRRPDLLDKRHKGLLCLFRTFALLQLLNQLKNLGFYTGRQLV